MNRRALLRLTATGTALASVSGCLDQVNWTDDAAEPIAVDSIESRSPADGCGPASLPLSQHLVADGGCEDSTVPAEAPAGGGGCRACEESADGSDPASGIVVENEREESVEADVTVESGDGTDPFQRTYELEAGERTVEYEEIPSVGDRDVRVALTGDSVAGAWREPTCRRHGIAIRPDGVAIGYVPPHDGTAGEQYTCYAGDPTAFVVRNAATEAHTVTVSITDRCVEESSEETADISAGGTKRVEGLEIAGTFEIAVAVEGGESATERYGGGCPSVDASVGEDGTITFERTWG